MRKSEARARIQKLRAAIEKYRYAYHVEDTSLIEDDALDSLKHELAELERLFPELITPDSPTQRVAGEPLTAFKKVPHETPMMSLNDIFSEEEVRAWFTRLKNFLKRPLKEEFYCELKLDGLAVELVYEEGVFVEGSTRGNGLVGEDVTQNLKTVEAIPLTINTSFLPAQARERLVVRGEVFLTKREFARINREQEKAGGKTYANPRNVAAGAVRQLDSRVTASRKLDSYAYDIVTDLGIKTHEEEHEALKKMGFKTNPNNKLAHSLEEVVAFRNYWEKHRDSLPYEVDGTVIIVNRNTDHEALGFIGKAPRGAVAYKFSPREATTTVENVVLQVGRTGVITPVAVLSPVLIGGVTVERATLHNFEEIDRLGLKIGDTVILTRAGDVIPKVTKVLAELRTGKEKKVTVPKKCPVDGSPIRREDVLIFCSNPNCGARERELFYHFVSRAAFDIRGLGPKVIDRLVDTGLIMDRADIFGLKREDIEALERFGEKSAENLIREIGEAKRISPERFLYSLGIVNVGEETSRDLAGFYPFTSVEDLLRAYTALKTADFERVPDIGPKVAESLRAWFKDVHNRDLLRRLAAHGIEFRITRKKKTGKLTGKAFVFTGTLPTLTRDEAKDLARAEGADISESVSKNTDYVVAGEEAGSKLAKAEKLGVTVLDEEGFRKLLKG
jgi:DNA ligase (NAD+)